jgi:hypothetical protein
MPRPALAEPVGSRVRHPKGAAMPPTRSDIRDLLTDYLERHPAEREQLAPLLAALDAPSGPTSRATMPGHVTCSAVVIDRDRRVLHIGHRATRKVLATGVRAGSRGR